MLLHLFGLHRITFSANRPADLVDKVHRQAEVSPVSRHYNTYAKHKQELLLTS